MPLTNPWPDDRKGFEEFEEFEGFKAFEESERVGRPDEGIPCRRVIGLKFRPLAPGAVQSKSVDTAIWKPC